MGREPVAPKTSEPKRLDIMRNAIHRLALAGVLAIGGLTGLGTTSAQAQGFGGYPGGGYGGYPGGGYDGYSGGGYPGGYGSYPVGSYGRYFGLRSYPGSGYKKCGGYSGRSVRPGHPRR